jgi:predicted ATP-grasp superfamily ATP-dependent carboligase
VAAFVQASDPALVRIADPSCPVVVLRMVRGVFQYGGLGIVRSLGRLGVPVYTFHDDAHAPAAFSRYGRRHLHWDFDDMSAEAWLEYLEELGRRIGRRAILIPTDDLSSLFVAEHTDALQEHFLFPRVPAELVRSLTSKYGLYQLCKRLGVPTPEVVCPRSRPEVLAFVRCATFPVVIKSIDPRLLQERRAAKSVVIARDADELLGYYATVEDPARPNLMLQEYIPGGAESVWMFNGYFDQRAECLVGYTGQKIRQHRPYTGVTTLGICQQNEVVEQTTRQFMRALGYRGILDMGYRYDARDGQYKVLDVNPRIGATFRLFVGANQMDVVRALYLDLTGQAVPPALPIEGRKWLVEHYDVLASRIYHRDGHLSLSQWVSSLRGLQEAAWFARDDPLPFLAMCWRFLAEASVPRRGRAHNSQRPF